MLGASDNLVTRDPSELRDGMHRMSCTWSQNKVNGIPEDSHGLCFHRNLCRHLSFSVKMLDQLVFVGSLKG
ncbi:hypothetical protein EUGRSUZ_F01920 [Eucalyptus grandis]|uniref:Uncharacterized protein n=2 Tax=Eucalyptus grandis TaxID=71139 RepID=A0ACC3KFX0_EUCGR|nr:hypothetical protein EUGRSUZ_F01920 [Eucalyptus grandis]